MLGDARQAVHGFVAEPRAQPFDELRDVLAGVAPVVGKELGRVGVQVDERTAHEPHAADRFGQLEPREPLAQQFPDALRLRPDGLHEAQAHAREGSFAMTQLDFDRLHAAAALAQETAELGEHRLQHEAEPRGVVDLGLEVASQRKFLVRRERRTGLG